MTIHELYIKASAINFPELVVESIEDNKDLIINMNQTQLFSNSEKQTGIELTRYSMQEYAEFKNYLNPTVGFGRPDLYFTGQFFGGFYVKVTKSAFEVDSYDKKTDELISQYGDTIFGVKDEYLADLSRGVQFALIKKIKEKL